MDQRKGRDFVVHQRACLENLFLEYEETGKPALGQIKARKMSLGQRRRRASYCGSQAELGRTSAWQST